MAEAKVSESAAALSKTEGQVAEDQIVLDSLINTEALGDQVQFRAKKNSISSEKAAVPCKTRCKDGVLRYRGYFYGILSAFLMAITNVFIKKVKIFTGSDLTLVRYALQFTCMAIILRYKKLPFIGPKDLRKPLILRGTIGLVGLLSVHFAVKLIDPSDTLAVFNSSIVITAIFARIFLKEKLSLAHIFSIVLTVTGIVLISQPTFLFAKKTSNSTAATPPTCQANQTRANCTSSQASSGPAAVPEATYRLVGIGLAFLGSVASGIVPVVIKHLSNHQVHFASMIIYATYFGIPVSSAISIIMIALGKGSRDMSIFKDPYLLTIQLFYAILAASAGLASQVLWNLALKHEDASKVSVMRSLELVFVFFQQYIFLGITSNVFSIVGAMLIFLGALGIILYKILDKKYSIKASPTPSPNKDEKGLGEPTVSEPAEEHRKCNIFKKIIFYKL